MDAFLIALVMVFLAEMGDKTQLVALTLAGRYRLPTVLSGILLATALVLALSVLCGRLLGGLVAEPWLQFLAGVSFLLFGIWTLRGSDKDENTVREASNPFLVVFWTFLLGELGDKTMLTTTSLAAQYRFSAIPVWTGSTLGMIAADLLAIGVGWILGTKLPERGIRRAVAVLFLALGAWDTWTSGKDFPLAAWGGAAAFLLGATLILFRTRFRRRPAED